MSEPRRGVFDPPPLEIAENPARPVVEARPLASGVLKIKRGEKQNPSQAPITEGVSERARIELERIQAIGRRQGGTTQGSAGGGQSKRGGIDFK